MKTHNPRLPFIVRQTGIFICHQWLFPQVALGIGSGFGIIVIIGCGKVF